MSIIFLNYSTSTSSKRLELPTLNTWASLALDRDHFLFSNPIRFAEQAHPTNPSNTEFTPLQCYVKFTCTIGKHVRIIRTFLSAYLLIIPLITVGTWQMGRICRTEYHNSIELWEAGEKWSSSFWLLASTIIASEISEWTATPTSAVMQSTAVNTLASVQLARQTLGPSITPFSAPLSASLPPSPSPPPSNILFSYDWSDISTAIVSAGETCQSSCAMLIAKTDCFTSCISSNGAVPSLLNLSEADFGYFNHEPSMATYFGVFMAAAALSLVCLLSLALIPILVPPRLHKFDSTRRKVSTALDLVEGLSTREAEHDKDKAFALQSILQRLLRTELPAPNYSRPLEEIYKELTIHVIQVTNSLQLLLLSSLNSLPVGPSWVPNWAANVDPFWSEKWLSNYPVNMHNNATSALQSIHDNTLVVQGRAISTISNHFSFQETSDTYEPGQRDIHLKNLETMIKLEEKVAECTSPFISWLDFDNAFPHWIKIACPKKFEKNNSQIRSWSRLLYDMRGKQPEEMMFIFEGILLEEQGAQERRRKSPLAQRLSKAPTKLNRQ